MYVTHQSNIIKNQQTKYTCSNTVIYKYLKKKHYYYELQSQMEHNNDNLAWIIV